MVSSRRGMYEIRIQWIGYDRSDEDTWEPISQIGEDMEGVSKDYLHTASERSLKWEIIALNF